MKKNIILLIIIPLLVLAAGLSIFPKQVLSQDSTSGFNAVKQDQDSQTVVNLYVFYGEGCPHCGKQQDFLRSLKTEYKDQIEVLTFEIYYSPANAKLMESIGTELEINVSGVPLLFIEDQPIAGFGSADTTGLKIRRAIEKCLQADCTDEVGQLIKNSNLAGKVLSAADTQDNPESSAQEKDRNSEISLSPDDLHDQDFKIMVPLLGRINLKNLSLPALTILLGGLDGFNPCAMWILIFLITMLINLEDKRRLFILGFAFIFVSALVYFVFLAAWFNLFQFIGFIYWIRFAVGIIAIASGIYHLKNYYEKETGCKVTNTQQRSKLIKKMKTVIQRQSLWLALAGISLLAVSVNLIELVCSAGLPAIYTNILSLAELSTMQYYSYLGLYTLVFMIDDLFVFVVAVKTFEVTGITTKYTKASNLIGGILIFILGLLLIFRPQALMFG